jgi:hypothetical protein
MAAQGTPSVILPEVFGISPDPSTVQPTNTVQRTFLTNLPGYATNPIVGAIIGALVAVIGTFLLSFILQLIINPIITAPFSGQSADTSGGAFITNTFTSNVVNLIVLELHASLAFTVAANLGSAGATGSIFFTLPILLLLAIPAVSLAVGGYIASATDYSNRLRFVLGRAAAVGPIYGVLMALISGLFGNQSASIGAIGSSVSYSFGPTWYTVLLYGVLWGILFGMLGGFIKIFGWRWRVGAIAFLANTRHSPAAAGALGALAAVGLGILLALPVAIFALGASSTSTQFQQALAGSAASGTASTQGLTTLLYILFTLPLSIGLLAFGSGASLSANIGSSIGPLTPQQSSIWLFDSRVPHALLFLSLIPIFAYFFGGRVAARLAGSADQNTQIQAGALMGVFSAIVMFLLSLIIGINMGIDVPTIASTFSIDFAIGAGSAFLGTLVVGVVLGVIGAALYRLPAQQGAPRRSGGLLAPLDRLTQQPADMPRGAARTLLYAAVLAVVVVTILTIMLNISGGALARAYPFTKLQGGITIWGGIVLALPLLLFVCAWAADLVSVPPDSARLVQMVAPPPPSGIVAPPVPVMVPSSAPYAPMSTPYAPPSIPYAPPSAPVFAPQNPPDSPSTTSSEQ